MSDLERTWRLWLTLSRPDRARFLAMLKSAYSAEREMMVQRRGGGAPHAERVFSLGQLALREADLQRARP